MPRTRHDAQTLVSLGKEAAVTKESKLALIIGFVLVLVVGVLVSDHFSQANKMSLHNLAQGEQETRTPIASLGTRESQGINNAFREVTPPTRANEFATIQPPVQDHAPIQIDNTNPADTRSILDDAMKFAQDTINNTEFHKAAEWKPKEVKSEPTRPLPEKKYQSYKVVAGDTLIGIARRLLGNGDRYTEIESLNADKLGPDLVLKIGMTLVLPEDARIITLEDRGTKAPVKRAGDRVYTVKSGDTLGEIAYKLLGTSKRADEIVKLNGLESADTIFVGMTLKIPAE